VPQTIGYEQRADHKRLGRVTSRNPEIRLLPAVSFSTLAYDAWSPIVALSHFLPFLFIPI